jgi:hypothetical protein
MSKGLHRSLRRGYYRSTGLPTIGYSVNDLKFFIEGVGPAPGWGTFSSALPPGFFQVVGGFVDGALIADSPDLLDNWSGNVALGTEAATSSVLSGDRSNIIGVTLVGPAVNKLQRFRLLSEEMAFIDNSNNDQFVNFNLNINNPDVSGNFEMSATMRLRLVLLLMGGHTI